MRDPDTDYDAACDAEAEDEWRREQGYEKPTDWWLENGISESDFLDSERN